MRALHWFVRALIVCSAPLSAIFYKTVPIAPAVTVAVVLFISFLATLLFEKLSGEAVADQTQNELIIRFGDLLTTLRKGAVTEAQELNAIRACLGILELFALNTTKASKGDISVSLILYAHDSALRMIISARNPGNERPTGRETDGAGLLGHRACQFDCAPRVVHHVGHFGSGFKSPTQSKPAYKSIFVIPLETEVNGQRKIRGFVSIDSRFPYAFYGNRANVIIVECEPVLNQIKELI